MTDGKENRSKKTRTSTSGTRLMVVCSGAAQFDMHADCSPTVRGGDPSALLEAERVPREPRRHRNLWKNVCFPTL